MASLGANAYVGTLNADTINYKTLNPALSGFVHNPMNSDLDADNRNIDNVNQLTTTTLNYTTLNPAINPGITNPMISDLDGGNNNITNVNNVSATSGSFTNSTLGTAGCGTLTATGDINGTNVVLSGNAGCVNLTASGNVGTATLSASGNATLSGTTNLNQLGSVAPAGIDLINDITANTMSSVLIEVPNINATTNLQALAAAIAVNLQVGGTILSQAIDNTYRIIANGYQTRNNFFDVGVSSSLAINSVDDPLYVLLTTTTGTFLSSTLTLTLPNTNVSYEGTLITIDGSGLAPALGPADTFNITASYTSVLVGGGSPVAETLPINGLNNLTIGRLRMKRDSNGRLKWVQDT